VNHIMLACCGCFPSKISSMQAKKKTVDPLSLWLSLRDNRDDRIQMALDEIKEKFLPNGCKPWTGLRAHTL
jgi:hypothetical protein